MSLNVPELQGRDETLPAPPETPARTRGSQTCQGELHPQGAAHGKNVAEPAQARRSAVHFAAHDPMNPFESGNNVSYSFPSAMYGGGLTYTHDRIVVRPAIPSLAEPPETAFTYRGAIEAGRRRFQSCQSHVSTREKILHRRR
jgi:hypothetical protein